MRKNGEAVVMPHEVEEAVRCRTAMCALFIQLRAAIRVQENTIISTDIAEFRRRCELSYLAPTAIGLCSGFPFASCACDGPIAGSCFNVAGRLLTAPLVLRTTTTRVSFLGLIYSPPERRFSGIPVFQNETAPWIPSWGFLITRTH